MKKVNLSDIPWVERKSPKGKYHRFLRDTAIAFKSAKTGPKLPQGVPFEVELVRMPPGAKNYPFHSHGTEWEFYLIVSGTGKVRAGKITRSLKAGDCVLNPPREPHQIINTGKQDLLYYVIANNAPGDFNYYPDSDKWAVSWDDVPIFRLKPAKYYDGEE